MKFSKRNIRRKIGLIAAAAILQWNTGTAQTGEALQFNGVNSYVDLGTLLENGASYTKEAWIYSNAYNGARNIVSSEPNPFWLNDNRLSAGNAGNYSTVVDPEYMPIGTWVYVAVTYDAATSTMSLYKNGLLVDQNTSAQPYVAVRELIGSHNTASVFYGSIDEVRIWNRALTAQEIKYNLTTCKSIDSGEELIASYHFTQGIAGEANSEEIVLLDATENENNGNLNFFDLSGSGSNWVAPGIIPALPAPGIDVQSVCGPFTWINGKTYTESNNVDTYTLKNASGCDSVVTLNLSITTIDEQSVKISTEKICDEGTATISTGGSQLGVTYLLKNAAGQTYLEQLQGSGSELIFTEQEIEATSTFNVVAKLPELETYLTFDGQDDYISFTNTSNIPVGNSPYTIEAWLKPNATGANGIVGWGPYGNNSHVNAFRFNGSTGLGNYWWDNDLFVEVPDMNDGQWHHVVATFDGTTRSIYLDGNLAGSNNPEGHFVDYADNLKIGNTYNGEYYAGGMKEIRIWNIGKTREELLAAMNKRLEGNEEGLVAYFDFRKLSSFSTTPDLAGGESEGTLMNFNTPEVWVKGHPECTITLKQTPTVSFGKSTIGTDEEISCTDFTWIDGKTYSESNNTATFTVINKAGCDSLVTLNLTIPVIDKTVSIMGNILTANDENGTFQWLDCTKDESRIAGETNQTFEATKTGVYGVLISEQGCTESSECIDLTVTGQADQAIANSTKLFPNPTNDVLNIDLGTISGIVNYTISTVEGRIVAEGKTSEPTIQLFLKDQENGFYFLKLKTESGSATFKIIKN